MQPHLHDAACLRHNQTCWRCEQSAEPPHALQSDPILEAPPRTTGTCHSDSHIRPQSWGWPTAASARWSTPWIAVLAIQRTSQPWHTPLPSYCSLTNILYVPHNQVPRSHNNIAAAWKAVQQRLPRHCPHAASPSHVHAHVRASRSEALCIVPGIVQQQQKRHSCTATPGDGTVPRCCACCGPRGSSHGPTCRLKVSCTCCSKLVAGAGSCRRSKNTRLRQSARRCPHL